MSVFQLSKGQDLVCSVISAILDQKRQIPVSDIANCMILCSFSFYFFIQVAVFNDLITLSSFHVHKPMVCKFNGA